MSEPFIGEIRMFAGTFAPRGYALCAGQLLAVSQNEALFSLLGTIYGGDGRTTFGLPDLRGRVPVHAGNGSGIDPKRLGAKAGTETVTLSLLEVPAHNHGGSLQASTLAANDGDANGSVLASARLYATSDPTVLMDSNSISSVGGNQSHTNVQPFLVINFIIALTGIFPSRT